MLLTPRRRVRPASRSLIMACQVSKSSVVQWELRSGAVQNKAVDVVGAEMLKRTGHRLRDLDGKRCGRIVGQAMVLAVLIGEFGLKKKIVAGDDAGAVCGSQSLADCGFKVVRALVGRIDGAKAGADGEFGEGCRAVFFPGGAVEKVWNGSVERWAWLVLSHEAWSQPIG